MLSGIIAGVVTALVLSLGFAVVAHFTNRSCSFGQAPATNPDVTSRCFKSGSTLPAGYTWDPGGNR